MSVQPGHQQSSQSLSSTWISCNTMLTSTSNQQIAWKTVSMILLRSVINLFKIGRLDLQRNLATEVNLAAADTREDRAVRRLADEISKSLASSWQRTLQTIVSTHLRESIDLDN